MNKIVVVFFDEKENRKDFYRDFTKRALSDGVDVDIMSVSSKFPSGKKRPASVYEKKILKWLEKGTKGNSNRLLFLEAEDEDFRYVLNIGDYRLGRKNMLFVGDSVPEDERWLYDYICEDATRIASLCEELGCSKPTLKGDNDAA